MNIKVNKKDWSIDLIEGVEIVASVSIHRNGAAFEVVEVDGSYYDKIDECYVPSHRTISDGHADRSAAIKAAKEYLRGVRDNIQLDRHYIEFLENMPEHW